MPQFSTEFWLQIIVYVASFAAMYGQVMIRLKYLETKVDKHNQVVERMAIVEQSTRSAHKRLDELREEVKENEK